MSFTPTFPELTRLTNGLLSGGGRSQSATYVAGGMPVVLGPPAAIPTAAETPAKISQHNGQAFTAEQLSAILSENVRDAAGNLIVPGTFGMINLGNGYDLQFDPQTLAGRITPALANGIDHVNSLFGNGEYSFTGSECRALIELAETPQGSAKPRFSKQLLELGSISISVHRVKTGANAAGYIGSKGYARGRRTVAGTIIFTRFTTDVLIDFLHSSVITDQSKDSYYFAIDQLPPFNITLFFSNEYGYASYQRLLGVDFVTSGTVNSIQDMLTEQVVTYVAKQLTPLLPLTYPVLFAPAVLTAKSSKERTVRDVWSEQRSIVKI